MRLSAVDLACHRGGRDVFTGLSFAVASGEVLAVTGRNGAGKSSLLRAIVGLVRIAHGKLMLEGGDPELTIAEQAHYLGHQDAFKPSLSAAENLRFWAGFLGSEPADISPALATVGLDELADLPAAYLSAGQRRRLSIARLVAIKRPIWLLDEPTNSLDAAAQNRLMALLRTHVAQGGIVVAATHGPIGLGGPKELHLDDIPPSPLVGEGRGGGSGDDAMSSTIASRLSTPTPNPSPQGGAER
jgi:heme exporter protein A